MSLLDTSLLVNLTIHKWDGRKFDRGETDALNDRHGIDIKKRAARVNKYVIDPDYIKPVTNLVQRIRNWHADMTVAWLDDGSRLLPATSYMQYMSELGNHKSDFDAAVDDLINNYDNMLRDSQAFLKTMFDPNAIPSRQSLRNKFSFTEVISPVPNTDFRCIAISDQSELISNYQDQLNNQTHRIRQYQMRDLQTECANILYKVDHFKRVHFTGFLNLISFAENTVKKNITDCQRVKRSAHYVMNSLAVVNKDNCKDAGPILEDCIKYIQQEMEEKIEPISRKSNEPNAANPVSRRSLRGLFGVTA